MSRLNRRMRFLGVVAIAALVSLGACGTTNGPRRSGDKDGKPDTARATAPDAPGPQAPKGPKGPVAPRLAEPKAGETSSFSEKRIVVPKGAAIVEQAAAERSPLRGELVPDFSLPNQDGETFDISAHAGRWVVMYFYPENDTPGCTCQATEFTEVVKEYSKRDAPVVGISPDSRVSHRNFIEKYGLKLTLLSDPALDVARRFGATRTWKLSSGILETVVRSTLLIDPEGKIAWHWPEVVPEGHAQRVLEKLVELRGA
jgi:thioredoxin-dependent peroxiredoxin